MLACISALNNCAVPVSVFIDDEKFFSDILPRASTYCRSVDAGSRRIMVFDNRGALLHDCLLSVAPHKKHTLEITRGLCFIR